MRDLAAKMATITASDAVPCITPPPFPCDKNASGSPIAYTVRFCEIGQTLAIQSKTIVSNSVHAGLQTQLKPTTLNMPDNISPKSPGGLELHGKNAKKFGCCQ